MNREGWWEQNTKKKEGSAEVERVLKFIISTQKPREYSLSILYLFEECALEPFGAGTFNTSQNILSVCCETFSKVLQVFQNALYYSTTLQEYYKWSQKYSKMFLKSIKSVSRMVNKISEMLVTVLEYSRNIFKCLKKKNVQKRFGYALKQSRSILQCSESVLVCSGSILNYS